jgi:hypothetical protein
MMTTTHFTLDSKATLCIIEAYEAAWNSLRGSIFVSGRREAETREIIVRCVVDMAERGERDLTRLRDGALQSVWNGARVTP